MTIDPGIALNILATLISVVGVWVSIEKRMAKTDAMIAGLQSSVDDLRAEMVEMHKMMHALQKDLHIHDRSIAVIEARLMNGSAHP